MKRLIKRKTYNLFIKTLNFFIKTLKNVSRIIFYIIPDEFKKGNLINKLQEQQLEDIWNVFSEDLKKSIKFKDDINIRDYSIKLALQNSKETSNDDLYYLEFGVWKGGSANFFSRYVKKFYVFDSFKGLPEEWMGNSPKGEFDLQGKIPKLNANVYPIVGYVEKTLEEFLEKHNPKINFVHLDMDLYSATKFTLEKIKPFLVKGCVIIFDEFYNFSNWQEGEYKALVEVFEKDYFIYKSFNVCGRQAVIQIK